MILAPDDVGDPGVQVVDGDREVVQGRTVGPGDHRVIEVDVGKAGRPSDHVVDHGRARVGHPQPDCPCLFGGTPEAPLGARTVLERPNLLGGGAGVVGVSALEQAVQRLLMAIGLLALKDRALVPIQSQPPQRVEDLLHVLGR